MTGLLQTSSKVSKSDAFKAAETSSPTYYDRISPERLKLNQVAQPVSCVHHWDKTKTDGMGQRRPGNVIVINVERKDPEMTEADTGVQSLVALDLLSRKGTT